jgi:hypothetical protein
MKRNELRIGTDLKRGMVAKIIQGEAGQDHINCLL